MIKFFRQIRQRLLSENKFSKYLIYAIGEIVLVVIGILIALSINNWNEERKSREQEKKIIAKLIVDLKWNLSEIEHINRFTLSSLKSSQTILNYLETNKPIDDSLKQCFEQIDNNTLFNIANTSYKYIESGGMNVLSNDTLRSRITVMYERHLKNIKHRETAVMEIQKTELRPLMNMYLESSEAQVKSYGQELALNKPLDMHALSKNVQFKNTIVRLQNFFQLRLNWQNNSIMELKNLVDDLANEENKSTTL